VDKVYCYRFLTSACLSVGELSKTAELIEMPFGALTHVDPRNHVLDGVQILPTGRGTFEGDIYRSVLTYLRMHGGCVCPAHAADECTAARDDKRGDAASCQIT